MEAREVKFLLFLKNAWQFTIPIYQRTYSWEKRECQRLWNDILRAGRDESISTHFMGSVMYIANKSYQVSNPAPPLLVIDGQQRLTTVSLLLEALARRLDGAKPVEPAEELGFTAETIREYYLRNRHGKGEQKYKLLLTQSDKETFKSIMDTQSLSSNRSLRAENNFNFFKKHIAELGDLAPLCIGLSKLAIVDVSLSRQDDKPQRIFESMNSTGKELSQADLIRNFVLMDMELPDQTHLYETQWRPMEKEFGQDAYGKHFDSFMRHYLTLKMGEIPKIGAVYETFRGHARRAEADGCSVDDLVAEVRRFAEYYCAMALNKEDDTLLARAFADLRELKVDVAYPFLLKLYEDYAAEKRMSRDDFARIIRWVESYVFRRAVCSIPTNSLNTTFASVSFGKGIDNDRYMESIKAHFLSLPSYRRFPNDEEFCHELKTRNLYSFRSSRYCFHRLEGHGRKEFVPDEYTIEHIMPQNENLSTEWKNELGADWERVRENWLHTLGNLTLTGYNSEYRDKPFAQKRDMQGGFRESPLRLNQDLRGLNRWSESEIQTRANRLAQLATSVWAAIPPLPAEVLKAYQSEKIAKGAGYTLTHYKYLEEGSQSRDLFDALRKEVMAIDPCVAEEMKKTYIAYKAETNFVDAVPRADGLYLFLNLRFHELRDPRKIAVDAANYGHWGNGDARVHLSRPDELPYAMGLIHQAFEKQMEEEAELDAWSLIDGD